MVCIIDKYRLCEFHLNALAGHEGEFCDLVTLGQEGRPFTDHEWVIALVLVTFMLLVANSANTKRCKK